MSLSFSNGVLKQEIPNPRCIFLIKTILFTQFRENLFGNHDTFQRLLLFRKTVLTHTLACQPRYLISPRFISTSRKYENMKHAVFLKHRTSLHLLEITGLLADSVCLTTHYLRTSETSYSLSPSKGLRCEVRRPVEVIKALCPTKVCRNSFKCSLLVCFQFLG